MNNWYVLTGAPGAGKTTTLEALAKKGYRIVPELARVYVDTELAKGRDISELGVNSERFEEIVLEFKIKREQELDPNELIFLDRGMHDTLAYYELYGWPIGSRLRQACRQATYKKIFLFELLDYKKDYIRTETEAEARQLQKLFLKVYREAGYDVIIIPRATTAQRVDMILNYVRSDV